MKVSRGDLLSDHHVIHSWFNIDKRKPPVETITYWKFKKLHHASLGRSIEKLLLLWQLRNLDHLVREYNQVLTNALDVNAPLRTKTLQVTYKQPWFMDAIRQEIRP